MTHFPFAPVPDHPGLVIDVIEPRPERHGYNVRLRQEVRRGRLQSSLDRLFGRTPAWRFWWATGSTASPCEWRNATTHVRLRRSLELALTRAVAVEEFQLRRHERQMRRPANSNVGRSA